MTTRRTDVQVRWILDLVDHATKPMLAADRQVRTSIEKTDTVTKRAARTQVAASREMTTAATRAAAGYKKEASAADHVADEIHDLSRAQAQALNAGNRAIAMQAKLVTASEKVQTAYREQGHAAKTAARTQERAFRRPTIRGAAGVTTRGVRGGLGIAGATAGAVGLGAFGVFGFGAHGIEEMEESRKVAAQTDAVLKSTGKSANATGAHIARLGNRLARLAGVDNEAVQQGENLLLTFTKIRNEGGKGNKILDRSSKAALDMSAAFTAAGKSMTVADAANTLGKALNDPATGYSRLTRAGVTFTESQVDQIKKLQKNGDTLGAQKIILGELSKEFGGSAKSQATSITRLNTSYDALAEAAGNAMAPTLDKAATALRKFFNEMRTGRGTGGEVIDTLKKVWEGAKSAAEAMAPLVAKAVEFVKQHPELLKIAGAMVAVAAAVKAIKFVSAITGISSMIRGLGRLRGAARSATTALETTAATTTAATTGGGVRGRLGRIRGRLSGPVAGGAAVAVGAGAAYLGSQVGGTGGSVLSGAGTGALTGAAIGSAVPGIGTAVGAIGGAVIGGVAGYITSHKDEMQEQVVKALDMTGRRIDLHLGKVTISEDTQKRLKDALEKAETAAKFANTHYGRGADPGFAKLAAAKFRDAAKIGGNITQQRVAAGAKYVDAKTILGGFKAQMDALDIPKEFRDTAAKSMVGFAEQLRSDGRLPNAELKKVVRVLSESYGDLVPHANEQGKLADKALASGLKADRSRQALSDLLKRLSTTFSALPNGAKLNGKNTERVINNSLKSLRQEINTSHGQRKRDAQIAYAQLLTQAITYGAKNAKAAHDGGKAAKDNYREAFQQLRPALSDIWTDIGTDMEAALSNLSTAADRAMAIVRSVQNPPAPTGPRSPSQRGRRGGRFFAAGGLVPVHVSPGEEIVYGGRSWMVPGARVAADSVFTSVPAGAAVLTDHGQALRASGATLEEALRHQAPHFAKGGRVHGLIGNAFDAGFTGESILGRLRDKLVPEAHRNRNTPSLGGSPRSPDGAPAEVAAMLARASAIASRGTSYVYGGGHAGFTTQASGYDCSGYVSNILGPRVLSSPMAVVQPMASALSGGPGKFVTVGMRGTSGQSAHTMMKIGSTYWESGSGHGAARVSGWSGGFNMYHPRGYRKGGKIGVGKVNTAAGAGKGRDHSKAFVNVLEQFGHNIDDATIGRLYRLRQHLQKFAKGADPKTIERLRGAISVVDHELGARARRFANQAAHHARQAEERTTALDIRLRRRGVDPAGVRGITATRVAEHANTATLRQGVGLLRHARKLARRAGDDGAVRLINQQMRDLHASIAESVTRQIELYREKIATKAQKKVDRKTFAVDVTQSRIDAIGGQDTAAGMANRAQALTTTLIPALAGQAAAFANQAKASAKIGDTDGARQAYLSWLQATNDMTGAMTEAGDLMRQAAETQAQTLVDAATHGSSMADLGLQRLELEQRISGKFDSGGKDRQSYINSTIRPAIEAEIAALQNQQNTAAAVGDTALADQIGEAVASKQNDLLQAQVDAMDQVAENTAPRRFGGTTGFTAGGETLTDLLVLTGNGA